VADTRQPLPSAPGQPERVDYEYEGKGTANLFMVFEPLAGHRQVKVTERRTAVDFAHLIQALVNEHYPHAEKIVLVMDNLNTHKPASLYEAFAPTEARRLMERLEIHYTPKNESWLNIAENELSVLAAQCLDRRILDSLCARRWRPGSNTAIPPNAASIGGSHRATSADFHGLGRSTA
jgi:hypothetical protein